MSRSLKEICKAVNKLMCPFSIIKTSLTRKKWKLKIQNELQFIIREQIIKYKYIHKRKLFKFSGTIKPKMSVFYNQRLLYLIFVTAYFLWFKPILFSKWHVFICCHQNAMCMFIPYVLNAQHLIRATLQTISHNNLVFPLLMYILISVLHWLPMRILTSMAKSFFNATKRSQTIKYIRRGKISNISECLGLHQQGLLYSTTHLSKTNTITF